MASPIRVFARDGEWVVDYGTYANGYHLTRVETVTAAKLAAFYEDREPLRESCRLRMKPGAVHFASQFERGGAVAVPSARRQLVLPALDSDMRRHADTDGLNP